jgi:hypothetical protein
MTAAPTLAWADDPSELADLWRWLEERGWPGDNGRRPDPAGFMCEAHRWADERERMVAECPECEGTGWKYVDDDAAMGYVTPPCEACGGTGRRA